MDQRDHARREIAAARRSMSEIAEELALRSSPAYLKAKGKEFAATKASQTREMAMSKVSDTREKAMSKVSEKRMDLQDSVREHPSAWSLAGGLVGLGVSSMLVKRFRDRDRERIDAGWRRDPQYGFAPGTGYGAQYGGQYGAASVHDEERGKPDKVAWAKAAAHDLKEQGHDLKERGSAMAHDLKERGKEVAHNLKDRSGSGDEGGPSFKERGSELKDRGVQMFHEREAQLRERGSQMRQRVEEDPLPVVIGALAIGAIAAFLLPVTSRERELSEPIAGRVRGRIDTLKGEASSRLGQVREQASESFSSFREQATETLKGHDEDHGEFGHPNAHDSSMRH